jgi:hypothetical protein
MLPCRTKKVFRLPEGIDTSFDDPTLQSIVGNSGSGGALNLSSINASAASAGPSHSEKKPRKKGGANASSNASNDAETTMDDFQQFLQSQTAA